MPSCHGALQSPESRVPALEISVVSMASRPTWPPSPCPCPQLNFPALRVPASAPTPTTATNSSLFPSPPVLFAVFTLLHMKPETESGAESRHVSHGPALSSLPSLHCPLGRRYEAHELVSLPPFRLLEFSSSNGLTSKFKSTTPRGVKHVYLFFHPTRPP